MTEAITKALGMLLTKNGKVMSKLVLDERDTTVYDKNCKATKMSIESPTILVNRHWKIRRHRTLSFTIAFMLIFTIISMNLGKQDDRSQRKALNLTLVQLSEKLSVTPQAVHLWESGQTYPDGGHF